jgi:hypothetical protein
MIVVREKKPRLKKIKNRGTLSLKKYFFFEENKPDTECDLDTEQCVSVPEMLIFPSTCRMQLMYEGVKACMTLHCLLLQEGGLLVLPGARAALAGTPGMIG